MRSLLAGADPLADAIARLVSHRMPEAIVMPPPQVGIEDFRWQFSDLQDSKLILDCSQAELLIVVKGLFDHIKELNNQLAIKDHAQSALVMLLDNEKEDIQSGDNISEHTVSS